MKENSRKVKIPKARKPVHPAIPALEWLSDAAGLTVRATAFGSRRLLIENHTGIQHFTDENVCLSTRTGLLCIQGRNLSLCEVRKNALIVHGCIHRLELPDEGGVQ